MAIIYSYPEIPDVQGGDLLLISDTGAPNKPTRSVDIDDLATYIGTVIGIGFWNLGTGSGSTTGLISNPGGNSLNIASGEYSVATNYNNEASGRYSFVSGENNTVSGEASAAFGINNNVTGDWSMAVGRGVSAPGDRSFAQGVASEARGGYSVALNFNTLSAGLMSLATGRETDAYGQNSASFGFTTKTYGTNSVVMGDNTIAYDYGSLVIGRFNSSGSTVTADRYNFNVANTAFVIGNGTNTSTRSDAFKVMFNGNTTVGNNLTLSSYGSGFKTGTATQRLAVDANGNVIEIPIGSGPVDGSGTANYTARLTDSDTLGIGALYDNGTNVGIGTTNPTQKLEVNGTVLLSTLPNSNGRLCLGSVNTNLFSNAASGNLHISTNGSSRMIILNNGDVGIGTTSPTQKLEVAGNARITGDVTLSNGNALRWTSDDVRIEATTASDNMKFYVGNTEVLKLEQANLAATFAGDITFGAYGAGTLVTDASGNVSVSSGGGAGGPYLPLAGGTMTGAFYAEGALPTTPGMSGTGIGLGQASNYAHAQFSGSAGGYIDFSEPNVDWSGRIIYTHSSDSMVFYTAATAVLTLDSSNNATFAGNVQANSYKIGGVTVLQGTSTVTVGSGGGTGKVKLNTTSGVGLILDGSNVGIGTTSPSEKLTINNNGDVGLSLKNEADTSGNYWKLWQDNWNGSSSFTFNVNYGGTDFMTLDTSGNVGIGTTSPSKKLEVNGTFKATGDASVDGTGNLFIRNRSATGSGIVFIDNVWQGGIEHNSGNLYFRTGGQANRMTIKTNGNVGIGTTNPETSLTIENASGGAASTTYSTTAANANLHLSAIGVPYYNHLFMGIGSATYAWIQSQHGNSIAQNLALNPIGGNVGIGTTSPGAPLHVAASSSNYTTTLATSVSNAATLIKTHATDSTLFSFGALSAGGGVIQRSNGAGTTAYPIALNPYGGNVGIGTTSPGARLEVVGSYAAVPLKVLRHGDYGNVINIGRNGVSETANIGYPADSTINLSTAGSERMRITSAGNVGIGTTSPGYTLDVDGSAQFNTNTGTTPFYITRLGTASQALSIKVMDDNVRFESIQDEAADNYGGFDFRMDGGVTEPDFVIRKNAGNPILNVKGDGNVGIGTTSPGRKLEVSGDVGIDNYIYHNGDDSRIGFEGNDAIRMYTANSVRLQINSSGNVGIGTTNPGAKLSVNGNVKIEGTNSLLFGGSATIPNWEVKPSGSDLVINDTGSNVGSVLFNNDKGVALPRLTTTQINAISSPIQGLMAYNTTLNTICFYNGSSWQKVSHANM